MNLRRASTSSPISVVKMFSVSVRSSSFTSQQCAALGIHGGFPELLRAHLAQAFVALHGIFLAAFVQHVLEELAHGLLLDGFRFGLALGGLGTLLLGFLLVGALGVAQLFFLPRCRPIPS